MSESEWLGLCRRLHDNIRRGAPDQAQAVVRVAAESYRNPEQWHREMTQIFRRVPLLVALGCDVPEPGDYMTFDIVGQPVLIVRGDDREVRVFLNVCRHRGARVAPDAQGHVNRFVCPYHSWGYDRAGALTAIPDAKTFGDAGGIDGLVSLPSVERAGAVFARIVPPQDDTERTIDLDDWLQGMLPSLAALRLDELHAYRKTTALASPNWKLAADGYLDGYHIGYLHKDTIGRKAINNRNTYDLFGPHARIGFANRPLSELDDVPDSVSAAGWSFPELMSLVHFVFPNVSMSGGHGETLMLSRLFPGPGVGESTTVQHQYFRQPLDSAMLAQAEEKRVTYERVVRDEDCRTIFGIERALSAMDASPVVFGRNEPANQRFHQWVAELVG